MMSGELSTITSAIRHAVRHATEGLVGREQLAELMILGIVAREHLLVIGPPGTAKSAVVRRVARVMGGEYFEYLLGRFTEPSELFGPVNLARLREGTVETDTTGMLPEADIAFLDEVFLGSTAILNTLLGILNERQFRRGHTHLSCPLKICVGAANALPDDDALAAFGDRFLLHLFIEPVPDHQLEAMLAGGWQSELTPAGAPVGQQQLETLHQMMRNVCLEQIRPALAEAVRALRQAGIPLSDRRIVRSQRLIAAAALLSDRTQATQADLWPLIYALPTQEMQQSGREILRSTLALAASGNLFSAVEEAALQPLSRAARLTAAADELLAGAAPEAGELENVLREIDANYSAQNIPDALAARRSTLIERLSQAGQ